jgi:hypothetical protein
MRLPFLFRARAKNRGPGATLVGNYRQSSIFGASEIPGSRAARLSFEPHFRITFSISHITPCGRANVESFNGSSPQSNIATRHREHGRANGLVNSTPREVRVDNYAEQNKRHAALGGTAVKKYVAKAGADHLRRIHRQFGHFISPALRRRANSRLLVGDAWSRKIN